MDITYGQKAEILTEALPYIQGYNGKSVVIKYGGSAMTDPQMKLSVMKDIVLLRQVGVKVVVIHGGGKEISGALSKMDIQTEFVNGLRKTDKATMEVVQMVLAGKVNKDLVNLIETLGGKALGLSGIDGHMLEVKQVSKDLGYVGEVTCVDTDLVNHALANGYIPVISTIGYDKNGEIYNINADDAAGSIAGALNAFCLISLTDTRGILRDKDNPDSLIPTITVKEAPELTATGVISGGMVPKLKASLFAIEKGVNKVFILDGKLPHAILIELFSDAGIGTMIL